MALYIKHSNATRFLVSKAGEDHASEYRESRLPCRVGNGHVGQNAGKATSNIRSR